MQQKQGFTISQLMTPLIAAALSALVAWVFKLDDRVYLLSNTVATKADVDRIESRVEIINDRLTAFLREYDQRSKK